MLTVMVGPAGSGKSTVAKQVVKKDRGNTARLNRDTLRSMMYPEFPWKWTPKGRGLGCPTSEP